MVRKKSYLLFFLFFCVSVFSYSQEQGLKSIVQSDLKRHLSFIASDSLQGRAFGTEVPGLDITANYLRNFIQKTGLKPGAESYFQDVTVFSVNPDPDFTFLKILDEKGESVYKTNSIICVEGGAKKIETKGNIVVAGFGWQDSKTGYDDFKGVDLNGKIVMFSEGNPDLFGNNDSQQTSNLAETAKMENAFEAGAEAVILVTSPKDKKNNTFNLISRRMNRQFYSIEKEQNEVQKFFIITPEVANVLFGSKRKYNKYLSSISKKNRPNSFELENFEIDIQIQRKVDTYYSKNVIGVVEGSNPELSDECIVFMAHYDHLGVDSDGDVFNGADDNGSGTTVLLELAEAFSSLDLKPERSIVFLWVTGEEIGMLGSNYYTQNPVFPMEKTIACINLDMVGRVFEPRDSVWKNSPKMVKDINGVFTLTNGFCPELTEICDSVCEKLDLVPDKSLPNQFLSSSDHFYFHNKNVPILNLATGYHADYHKVSDEVSKINFEKLKRITDLCFLVGYEMANLEK